MIYLIYAAFGAAFGALAAHIDKTRAKSHGDFITRVSDLADRMEQQKSFIEERERRPRGMGPRSNTDPNTP